MEILFFGAINPAFLNVSTLLYSTCDFIHVGIVALALTLVIITGGIDLSIGAVMGLSAITLGLLWVAGVNIWVACFCALGAGAITGIINSVAIQVAQVKPTGYHARVELPVLGGVAGSVRPWWSIRL